MTHILVVDDDKAIRELVQGYLTGEGFSVSVASTGAEMTGIMERTPVDLVLLDLRFPGEDGLVLAAGLRAKYNVHIIILSGRNDVVDRIVGLEVGADDYITKPFHLRELLARIRSVLRRTGPEEHGPQGTAAEPHKKDLLTFAGWQLDLTGRVLTAPSGEDVTLTSGDFRLLEVFVKHPKQVMNRDRLLDLVSGRTWDNPFDRSIDTRIRRLRTKIERDPAHPQLIKTVRGSGYVFAAKVERPKAALVNRVPPPPPAVKPAEKTAS